MQAQALGACHNAAEVLGSREDPGQPTCAPDRLWDGKSWIPSSSKLDGVLRNTTVRALMSGVEYVRDKISPGHLGLRVSFGMGLRDQMVTKWLKPAQYPVEHVCDLAQEEDDFFGATSIRGYEGRLESARTNKGPMEFWEVLNETGEEYVEWRQALADIPEGATRGAEGGA